jgi:acetyl esterase/lipase
MSPLKKYIHGTETPVVFSHEGMQIMGVLHRPEAPSNPPAVVFYHGCTGSRSEAHWLFVKLARYLAARGIMTLRFDFRHSGESEGDFRDMTLSGEISDGIRAVEYLVSECGADPARIGLLGISMGGAIAAIVASRLREKVKSCVLVNPVAKPFEDLCFLAQARAVDVSSFPVDFNSFLFGKAFFDELPSIRPLDEIVGAVCPFLVVNGAADRTVQPARSHEYVETLRAAGIPAEFFSVEGADHTFASAAWESMLFERVGEWFAKTL